MAERFAGQECGWSSADGALTEIVDGFGNHNWRVPRRRGDVLLKIGAASSVEKWAAARFGLDTARAAGLPVPQLLSTRISGEHVVRSLEWIVGEPAHALAHNPAAQAKLGAELGLAVARLHAIELESYRSRLDGSSSLFVNWPAYVGDRLAAIERRAQANEAPEPALRRRAAAVVESLAGAVNDQCRPVVCHRDLHPGNLIVGPDGSLNGIIDWDMAEGWDAAGEWFKLELFLFERLPHVRGPFESAYAADAPPVGPDRRRLVLLMESLNVVANAGTFADDFIAFGVGQLDELTRTSR